MSGLEGQEGDHGIIPHLTEVFLKLVMEFSMTARGHFH